MLRLRPYQNECVGACQKKWEEGYARLLVALATGLGKTILFSEIASQRIRKNNKERVLILAHLDELLTQATEKIPLVDPNLQSHIIRKGHIDHSAPVHLISVQSASTPQTLDQLRKVGYGLVIVDEAHHTPADEYQVVLGELGCFSGQTKLLGVTATPFRTDDRELDETFEVTAYKKGILEGIIEGYLADLRGIEVPIDCDLGQSSGSDYNAGKLGRILRGVLPEVALDTIQRYAPNRKTIIFVPTIEVARDVAATLVAHGISADHVSGEDTPTERRRKIADYRANKIRVLVNAMLLTEGFDDPETNCVIVARPTLSKGLYIQMIGRGLRLFPGKSDCLVVDLVPKGHKSPTLTLAEMAKVTPEEARNQGMRALYKKKKQSADSLGNPKWGDGRERNLFADLNWSRFEGEVYGIQVEKTSVVLFPVSGFDRYHPLYDVFIQEGSQGQFLHRSLSLPYSQGVAEDLIRDRNAFQLTKTQAGWRDLPVTDSQFQALQINKLPFHKDMTRGEACDLIQQSKLSRVVQALRRKNQERAA